MKNYQSTADLLSTLDHIVEQARGGEYGSADAEVDLARFATLLVEQDEDLLRLAVQRFRQGLSTQPHGPINAPLPLNRVIDARFGLGQHLLANPALTKAQIKIVDELLGFEPSLSRQLGVKQAKMGQRTVSKTMDPYTALMEYNAEDFMGLEGNQALDAKAKSHAKLLASLPSGSRDAAVRILKKTYASIAREVAQASAVADVDRRAAVAMIMDNSYQFLRTAYAAIPGMEPSQVEQMSQAWAAATVSEPGISAANDFERSYVRRQMRTKLASHIGQPGFDEDFRGGLAVDIADVALGVYGDTSDAEFKNIIKHLAEMIFDAPTTQFEAGLAFALECLEAGPNPFTEQRADATGNYILSLQAKQVLAEAFARHSQCTQDQRCLVIDSVSKWKPARCAPAT